jgi:hypothetical protein
VPKFTRPDNVPKMGSDEESWSKETTTLPVLVVPTGASEVPANSGWTKVEEMREEVPDSDCASNIAWRKEPLPDLNTTFHVPSDIVYSPAGPRPDQIVVVTASDGKGHNGGIDDILGRTSANRKSYCEYHGYNYHFVNISKFDLKGAHPVWKKIPAIVDAFNTFPESQWIFFLDLDAIIMSPKQDLTSLTLSHAGMQKSLDFGREYTASSRKPLGVFMPQLADSNLDELDMLIAQDHNGINAGSFFLRRSKFTQWLLDMWADPFFVQMEWPGKEQDTLVSRSAIWISIRSANIVLQLHFVKHHRMFREHVGLLKQRVANAYPEGGSDMRWQDNDLLVHLAGCWVVDKCQERWESFWDKRETI